jgi:hypothetical protein
MTRIAQVLLTASISAVCLFGQYKVERAGAPPADAAALAPALVKDGLKVLKPDGSVLLEMWLVTSMPSGGPAEENVSLTGVPHGSLMGVVRFPARHVDRRGQAIKPGAYSMRISFFPMNGDHQGVAPQRDFLLLSPIADDTDPNARPNFEQLVAMSKKSTGTPHPQVLSFWKSDEAAEGVTPEGDLVQILHTKIGSTPVSIIIVGKHEE